MRVIAAILPLFLVPLIAEAKPSRISPGEFKDDRWQMVAQLGADVARAARCPPPFTPECRRRIKKDKPSRKEKKNRPDPGVVAPLKAFVPLPRARPDYAPDPDEDDAQFNGTWNTIAVALNTLEAPRVLRGPPLALTCSRGNVFRGFLCEIERALPRRGVSLVGVVPPLVAKVHELMDKCGAIPISAVRRTYVRGSGKRSQHWDGRAVDIVGDPRCMYPLVARWPGGVSTDYYRIRPNHMHISYGGREAGKRFAHYRGGVKRTRYARHHGNRRYASR